MHFVLGWAAVVLIIWAAAHLNRKHRDRFYGPEETSGLIQRSAYIGGKHLWDQRSGCNRR